MKALTEGIQTKAEKIRQLGAAGYARQQIADFLGIRYQHVRNVLVDEERRVKASMGPPPADWQTDLEYKSAVHPDILAMEETAAEALHPPPRMAPEAGPAGRAQRVDVGPNGEVVLPKHMMDAAGTGPGKRLLVRFEDDEIKLVTPEATTRKIQAWVRSFVPEGVSLVDELREERRREFEREEEEAKKWGG